jgi:hypothetical protein
MNMKRAIAVLWIVAGLISTAVGAEPTAAPAVTETPKQIEFKFTFEPGRTTVQKVESKTVGTLKLPGPLPEQKFSQSYEQVVTSTCRKVNPDKSVVMDVTLGGIKMRMSVGPMAIDYDSATFKPDEADQVGGFVGKLFQAMEGAKFNVTVSETGRPLKVEGLSESLRKALSKIGDTESDRQTKKILEGMSKVLSDDQMNEQMQMYYRMVPPKQGLVKIGEKWDQTWSMKMPMVGGNFEGRGEYQLIGVEEVHGRPCAKIRVKESFKLQPGGQAPAGAEADEWQALFSQMNMEVSSNSGDGIAYVDYTRGEVVRLRQTQKITIKISPKEGAGEGAAAIPAMTQTFSTSVKLELIDEAAGSAAKGGGVKEGK